NGAGEGNRTLVFSLEGCCSTIELHPRDAVLGGDARSSGAWWRGLDSNQRTLSEQIYSLPDLTTLPPLHARRKKARRPGACAPWRFMVRPPGAVNMKLARLAALRAARGGLRGRRQTGYPKAMRLNRFPPKARHDPDAGPVYLYGLHTVRAALDNPRRDKHA